MFASSGSIYYILHLESVTRKFKLEQKMVLLLQSRTFELFMKVSFENESSRFMTLKIKLVMMF